jgi:hypothetical protein
MHFHFIGIVFSCFNATNRSRAEDFLNQFQGYECEDLKSQEDVKHLKQKLKKVEENIAKVIFFLHPCEM